MSSLSKTTLFVLVIVFQLIVLVWSYVDASLPLYFGREIAIQTQPVDPRSLFRGNYARLNYSMNRIPLGSIEFAEGQEQVIEHGDYVYTVLEHHGEVFRPVSHLAYQPREGTFIAGRSRTNTSRRTHSRTSIRVEYGIEAFFAPKEKAIALEDKLRFSSQVRMKAVIRVMGNGKAALVGVEEIAQ